MYVRDLQDKLCASDKEPEIVNETVSTALVEGHNLLGAVVGNFCMDLAIEKAKQTGIGWVVARGNVSCIKISFSRNTCTFHF